MNQIDQHIEAQLKAAWQAIFEGKNQSQIPEDKPFGHDNRFPDEPHNPWHILIGFVAGIVVAVAARLIFH